MLFAINPLIFLAGILLYAVGTSIRDHFRYRQSKPEPQAADRTHALEIRKGFETAKIESERRPAA